jgi:hypothetical protein
MQDGITLSIQFRLLYWAVPKWKARAGRYGNNHRPMVAIIGPPKLAPTERKNQWGRYSYTRCAASRHRLPDELRWQPRTPPIWTKAIEASHADRHPRPFGGQLERITEFFNNEVANRKAAGRGRLIQQHGKPVYLKCFGVR